VLENDEVAVVDQLTRDLVGEVPSLVADTAVVLGRPLDGTLPTVRAPLLRFQVSLCLGKRVRGVAPEASFIDQHTVRGRHEVYDAEVDAHLVTRRRERGRINARAADRDEPVTTLARDRDRLGRATDLAMQVDLDVADPLEVKSALLGP